MLDKDDVVMRECFKITGRIMSGDHKYCCFKEWICESDFGIIEVLMALIFHFIEKFGYKKGQWTFSYIIEKEKYLDSGLFRSYISKENPYLSRSEEQLHILLNQKEDDFFEGGLKELPIKVFQRYIGYHMNKIIMAHIEEKRKFLEELANDEQLFASIKMTYGKSQPSTGKKE